MEEQVGLVSKDGNGRMRLEYVAQGRQKIVLWETKNYGTIETEFNSEGHILLQRVVDIQAVPLSERVIELLRQANISDTRQAQFSDVKINKACPKCSQYVLTRYVEAFASKKEVPVMPLYYCPNCTTKSYHLTNEYLEYLIETNKLMFSQEEVLELGKDKSRFVTELQAYIIRIFASKKIMCIK
jgi:hypothetical protein